MYQKAHVMQAWAKAGLNAAAEPKLAPFFQSVDQAKGACWPQIAQLVRDKYPEYKERLLEPIWQTADPLLRLNLVRSADNTRDDERALLIKYLKLADPVRDAPALRAAAASHPDVVKAVATKKNGGSPPSSAPTP